MEQAWPCVENIELVQNVCGAILRVSDPTLRVRGVCDSLDTEGMRIALLGIGKASVPMARAAIETLGERAIRSLVVTTEHPDVEALSERSEVLVGDHPLATERNMRGAARVLEYLRAPEGSDQFLLVLLSGGGSALTTLPAPGLALADITRVSSHLMRRGCPIDELNCVRKHCELLKGGRMAALCAFKRIKVCVLSDVIGDPLTSIASGPFTSDPTTYGDAMNVLTKYDAISGFEAIAAHLRAGMDGAREETPKPGDALFASVSHEVVLNNAHATARACRTLGDLGHNPVELSAHTGEAIGGARLLAHALGDHHSVVMGGEPVVSGVPEGSRGGPMQEAVLGAALELESDLFDWLVMGFATDGRDGPTDAAGAAIDRAMVRRARAGGVPLEAALRSHDTHRVLSDIGALIRTGPTGTNINDVLIGVRS